MKNIAIITLYDDSNAGNRFQNYAVKVLVEKCGYECRTIKYVKRYLFGGLKSKLIAFLGFPKEIAEKKRFVLHTESIIKKFSEKYINQGDVIRFCDSCKIADKYDYYITGSDQVWHNWSGTEHELDYFFLRFAPPHKRLCISPSFGRESIPEKFRQQYIDGLNGFKHLSCREESGCRLIKELTGRDAVLLCDPTMAISAEQWDEISVKPSFELPEKYILTYFLGDAPEAAVKYVQEISERERLPVINLYNMNYPEYTSVQPDEFLYLVKHAEHFCTTSFHGCVFSIIYHTPFSVFERKDLKGMHGRIETLLKKFGLESCRDADENFGKPCDFSSVDDVLENERIRMYDYLEMIFADAEKGEDVQ